MKTWILLPLVCISYAAGAQIGDFSLPGARPQASSVADSSLEGGPLKNLFIGKNYRREWTQPLTVPVINLQKDLGGLKVEKEGGGKQTHSLQLKDGQDREWVLRSVKKYIESSVPDELKGTIGQKLIEQGISASYPYAVLTTGRLAKAVGVPYLPNTLVQIPDDKALGEFREKYANTLSFLELRTPSRKGKNLDTEETHKLLMELIASADKVVDQRMVLRARLLDNFIFDFDRHEDQWVWAEVDSNDRKYYYPIPKDRDQAYYKMEGLIRPLAKLAGPVGGVLQGLRPKAKNIATFNFSARNFDKLYINEPDEKMWEEEVDRFLLLMTDAAIDSAFAQLPRELQDLKAKDIKETLKKRKVFFKEDMMNYYRFLSDQVTVWASNKDEEISVDKRADGSMQVQIKRPAKDDKPELITYNRIFDPTVTTEVHIYGLEGDDKFQITGGRTPIRLRLVGGPGDDVFTNQSSGGEMLVYDLSLENNRMEGGGFTNKMSDDAMVNEFRTRTHNYTTVAPGAMINFTQEGGLMVGPNLRIITRGFRDYPFGSKHTIFAIRSLTEDYYAFRYYADIPGRKTDKFIRTDVNLPTVRNNFYGFGNNTSRDASRPDSYYRVHFVWANLGLQFSHKITSAVRFNWGPVMQYYKLRKDENLGKFIRTTAPLGNPRYYDEHMYAGGELGLEWNTRNDQRIPSRGVFFNTYARGLAQLQGAHENLVQTGGRFSFYTDFIAKDKVIFASSFGAHHNIGAFGFPQAQYLGFRQDLRGYRFQRFAGRTRAFNNTDLRLNLGTLNLYLVKGPAGLIGFHDVARVWMDGENSDNWHRGYGGGVWISPFKALVVVGALTFSEEEKAFPQISFGFQF